MRLGNHPLLVLLAGGALALGACDDGTGDSSGGTTTHDDHGHDDHDDHDHGSETHGDHDGSGTHGDHDGSETHGHDGSETGHESGSTGTGGESTGTTTSAHVPPSPEGYCECMLDVCHDLYHSTWGEDHVMSEMNCLDFFNGIPSAGMPAMEGSSQECLAYHCEAAANDPGLCESAIGGGVCI